MAEIGRGDSAAGIPGPPYPPENQALGEIPSIIPDVPINVVFLLLFLIGGIIHMTILQINERRHHKKFAINGAVFGFCVTRVCATSLRIAWSCDPTSIRLGLAATIFFYAGVVLLFIANLFFAQRIVRAQHPYFGWTWPVTAAVPVLIGITIATIFCLIVAIIVQFYSLNLQTKLASRAILLYGATFYLICALVPVPVVVASTLARRYGTAGKMRPLDKFGEGSMRAKVAISLISGLLLTLGAGFRAGTSWMTPTPILTDTVPPEPFPQPWYFGKPAYYSFDFVIEAFIVWLWIIVRIDRRFIIPNGSKGPYSYGEGFIFAGEAEAEKNILGAGESQRRLAGSQSTINLQHGAAPLRRESTRSFVSNRVSWGGISRESIHHAIGEDGVAIAPYVPYGEADDEYEELAIAGAEQEMGWDTKSGKWALRSVYRPVHRDELDL